MAPTRGGPAAWNFTGPGTRIALNCGCPISWAAATWTEEEDAPLQRTPLFDWHKAHTRKVIPFAGWEMPVWYTGVLDEHNAVRKAAGLFDVAHMGVF